MNALDFLGRGGGSGSKEIEQDIVVDDILENEFQQACTSQACGSTQGPSTRQIPVDIDQETSHREIIPKLKRGVKRSPITRSTNHSTENVLSQNAAIEHSKRLEYTKIERELRLDILKLKRHNKENMEIEHKYKLEIMKEEKCTADIKYNTAIASSKED